MAVSVSHIISTLGQDTRQAARRLVRSPSFTIASVLTLALVLLTYGGTALLQGSGFLAVYLAGLVMGSSDFVHKRSLIRFHDGLAWLMQITMFLVLGLLVFPSRLLPVAGTGLLIAFFLIAPKKAAQPDQAAVAEAAPEVAHAA